MVTNGSFVTNYIHLFGDIRNNSSGVLKGVVRSKIERVVFDAPYLGQFLSDFVRLKSNVSPRPSTLTYPREIFYQIIPLKKTSF